MTVYASLLSQVPIPQKQWQTKSDTPVIASVNVGGVVVDGANPELSRFERFLETIKSKILKKRLAKLESIPQEKRTLVQQAEIDANKNSFDYMV